MHEVLMVRPADDGDGCIEVYVRTDAAGNPWSPPGRVAGVVSGATIEQSGLALFFWLGALGATHDITLMPRADHRANGIGFVGFGADVAP